MNQRIKAVLFDMDGTLIDSEPIHEKAICAVIHDQNKKIDHNLYVTFTGLQLFNVHQILTERIGLTQKFSEFTTEVSNKYKQLSQELKARKTALNCLRKLEETGIPYAIVSNAGRELLNINIAALGINKPELISVSRNDVREGKPFAEPYLRAAWLLKLNPSECIVVEDSSPGAISGINAGMKVIAWPDKNIETNKFPPTVIYAQPDDLWPTLEQFLNITTN